MIHIKHIIAVICFITLSTNIYADNGYDFGKEKPALHGVDIVKDSVIDLLFYDQLEESGWCSYYCDVFFNSVRKNTGKPSFNCSSKKLTPIEKVICDDGTFSFVDKIYSGYYSFVYKNLNDKDKKELKKIAKEFLKSRNQCWAKDEFGEYTALGYKDLLDKDAITQCFEDKYNEGMISITRFLLDNKRKYQHILDKLYSNSPIYYISNNMYVLKKDFNKKTMKIDYNIVQAGITPSTAKPMIAMGIISIKGDFLIK